MQTEKSHLLVPSFKLIMNLWDKNRANLKFLLKNNLKDSRGRDFCPHSTLCTIDGYIMETRFWWQVREILDFREVLKFKNIKKNCNGYLSKSSRK